MLSPTDEPILKPVIQSPTDEPIQKCNPLPEISLAGEELRFIASSARLLSIPPVKWTKEFLEEVKSAGQNDSHYRDGLKATGRKTTDTLTEEDGILYHNRRLWVPGGLTHRVLKSEHDSKVAGHFGQDKTNELIRRNFWWPKMDDDIIQYIQSCPNCQHDKSRRHRKYGLVSPLELPYALWQSIAMDFITDLPQSMGCSELWVVIDRFMKMAHFIPLSRGGKTAEDHARIFARKFGGFTEFHGTSSRIETPGSPHLPGRYFWLRSEANRACPQRFTHRPIDKPRGSTRQSKPISAHLLTRSRVIGAIYSRWRSTHTTTRPRRLPDRPPSMPTTGDTQKPPLLGEWR